MGLCRCLRWPPQVFPPPLRPMARISGRAPVSWEHRFPAPLAAGCAGTASAGLSAGFSHPLLGVDQLLMLMA